MNRFTRVAEPEPTAEEIAAWPRMTTAEKVTVNSRLFAEFRESVLREVRADRPTWPEQEVRCEAFYRIHEGEVDRETCRRAFKLPPVRQAASDD